MTLEEILVGLQGVRVTSGAAGLVSSCQVREVRDDSRKVEPGDLFLAIPGTTADGKEFLRDAIARQAEVLVLEEPRTPGSDVEIPRSFRGTVVMVPNARHALAVIAANRFAGGRGLTLSAVTGTNGKTTTTYLMESMLAAGGLRAGVLGTVGYWLRRGGPPDPMAKASHTAALWQAAPLTTPGPLALHSLLAEMRLAGATDVVLEASSHALDQGRLDGCRFRVAGLTNLTQDHLDYHGTMDRYLEAKTILFSRLLDRSAGVAVLPVDRPEGRAVRARVLGGDGSAGSGHPAVLGVAERAGVSGADVVVESVEMSAAGLRVRLATPSGALDLVSPLLGGFNVSNILLAVGMGIARGLDRAEIASGVEHLRGVPGRLERVENELGVLCLVDYAHTPDALERALAAVRPLVDEGRGGRLITVFGCGGDRDRAKRPLMGAAAAAGSDLAIVTSDNPRSEQPERIVLMILEGVRRQGARELESEADLAAWKAAGADRASATEAAATPNAATAPGHFGNRAFYVAVDRGTAIRRAVSACRAGDVVLIAGKGHEDYQIVGRERLPFDDREEAAVAFQIAAAWAAEPARSLRVGREAPL